MKTVSKLFTAAVVLFTAIACQSIDEGKIETNQLEVSATIVGSDDTKVDYDVTNDKDHNVYSISPEWTVDDEIIGFDNLGHTFTFTAAGVSPNGKNATFTLGNYKLESGVYKLYAIYAPGYSTENFKGDEEGKYLEIDLSSQGGVLNGAAPVLMCATGTINGGKVNFSFANQTAIIGVNRFQLYGATVNKVNSMTLNGVVTEGKFEIGNEGNLVLNPTGSATSITATNGDTGWALNNGICEAGVYFAAIPSTNATLSLEAFAGEKTYKKVDFVTGQTLEAGKYYHTARVLESVPVAKVTIGETNTDYYTIYEAFDAANNSETGATITLLNNCSTSNQLTINNSGSEVVTLDLNGKTLSLQTNNSAYIYVYNGRDFTITDSSSGTEVKGAIQTSDANCLVNNYGGGIFTIEGGKMVFESPQGSDYAIITSATTTNITGGTITSSKRGVWVGASNLTITSGVEINSTEHCIYNNAGVVTINGGTFKSESKATATSYTKNATTTVNGGYFSSLNLNVELFTVTSGSLTVKGGFFDRPINNKRTATRQNFLNDDELTKKEYPFTVGSYSESSTSAVNSTDSYSYNHLYMSSAAKHAQMANTDITIKLSKNVLVSGLNLTNDNNKRITLDLNDKTISSTSSSSIITTTGLLTINGGAEKKGIITSSYSYVVRVFGTDADVIISDCTISSTNGVNADRTSYVYPAAVYLLEETVTTGKTNSKLTISGAKIYTENNLTAVSNRNGKLIIEGDSEISSGTVSAGLIGVMTGDNSKTDRTPSTIIKSGVFYSSNTSGTRPAVYLYGTDSEVSIEGGYFYSEGTRSIRAADHTWLENITLSGGYYNKDLTYVASKKTYNPTYAEGFEKKTDQNKKITHSIKGELVFNYAVGQISSQETIPTPGEDPVASLGSAVTGGITF